MTYLSRTRCTAGEALQLRDWAARVVLTGVRAFNPPVSAEAWRVVLEWERCALLLQESLGENTALMPAEAAEELRTAAIRESMWILSARAQLRTVAKLAATEGISVIVLKGTADVARGRNVLVTDVDVLARPKEATRLAELLDAAGFVAGPRGGRWHLAERTIEGGLNVEVHVAVTGFDSPEAIPWQNVRPIEGFEPLLELAPADRAWTVLSQAIRKHPDRRMRIRDLYLVRGALSECTVEERAALDRRVSGDADCPELVEMIGLATDADRMDTAARRRLRRLYLLHTRAPRGCSNPWIPVIWRRVVDGVAAGPRQDWERNQRLREDLGGPRWGLLRRILRPLVFLATTTFGWLMCYDEFRVAERPGVLGNAGS